MSADFTPILDTIKKEDSSEKTDEPTAFINESFASFGWKSKFLMFLVFLLVCSTMFIENVIGKFGPDMIHDARSTTNKGTVVQGILLVLIYSMFEMFLKNRVL